MSNYLFICCILLTMAGIVPYFGSSHKIRGSFFRDDFADYMGFPFLERTLFTRNTSQPESYVVGFKYVGDVTSTVIYGGEISSTARITWATGDLSNGLDLHDNHYLNARMNIENATDFKVDVSITGSPGLGNVMASRFSRLNIFRPRSSALICLKRKYKTQTPHREIVFGKRKDGDFIVYAERNNFSATETHLPRHKIEFQDNNVVLTAVLIRLNSTMAIVFSNKVKLSEHEFVGTIYGLQRDTITNVVIIIYGYRV